MHLDRMTSSLEEWSQSRELDGTTSSNRRFQTTWLLNFEEYSESVELRSTERCLRAVNI